MTRLRWMFRYEKFVAAGCGDQLAQRHRLPPAPRRRLGEVRRPALPGPPRGLFGHAGSGGFGAFGDVELGPGAAVHVEIDAVSVGAEDWVRVGDTPGFGTVRVVELV